MKSNKRTPDGILDNQYNTNDVAFSVLPDIKVDPSFRYMNPENVDSYDHHRILQLEEFIIIELKNYDLDTFKKNKKKTLDVFYEIYEKLDTRYYTEVEFFVFYCEILKINLREFYLMLLPKLRSKLLFAVTDPSNIKNNRVTFYKLF